MVQPHYRCAGNYPTNLEPDAVRQALMACCDGWLSTDGKGRLVIKVGRYVEPTFTLTADHIEGFTWRAFTPDESACNVVAISYVSPEHDYTLIDAEPWRNEADISASGKERIENLQLNWVDRFSQSRRLAKRKMARLNPGRSGQITAGIHGLNGLGHRYIRVQNPRVPSMADVVVEVLDVEIDFTRSLVVFDVIKADPNIDAWDWATEEGTAPATTDPSDPGYPYVEPPSEFDVTAPLSAPVFVWRNPSTVTFDKVQPRWSTSSNPLTMVNYGDPIPGAPGATGTKTGTALPLGTRYFWLVAIDIFGSISEPVGPVAITTS